MAPTVSLRPVADADMPILELIRADPQEATRFGFHGFLTNNAMRREYAETGLLGEDGGVLAVTVGGETVGSVGWHRVRSGPISFTWNIGISLLGSARGNGYGTAAQRALAEYLFGYTRANRVEARTETDDYAEQRALEKAGFTREGVLRGACFRAGRWRDMAMYSMVRADIADLEECVEPPVAG
jgi:RimJ/RimL family protein N-acetyltransferase